MNGWLALPHGMTSVLAVRDGIAWLWQMSVETHEVRVVALDLAHGRALGTPYTKKTSRHGFGGLPCVVGLAFHDWDTVYGLSTHGVAWSRPGHLLAAEDDTVVIGDPAGRVEWVDAATGEVRGAVDLPHADQPTGPPQAAVLADGIAVISEGGLVRVAADGTEPSRQRVAEGAFVLSIDGALLVGEPAMGPTGPITRLHGALEIEVRGHVRSIAGSARGLAMVCHSAADGASVRFVTPAQRIEIPVQSDGLEVCVADEHALLATGAFGAVWHARTTRSVRWPQRTWGSGGLWDGMPILEAGGRLFPLSGGRIPPWSPPDARRTDEIESEIRFLNAHAFGVDLPEIGTLVVPHPGAQAELEGGEPVWLRLEVSELGTTVAEWRTAKASWTRTDLVLEVLDESPDEPDPETLLDALRARDLPIEPALEALIAAWKAGGEAREALEQAGLHLMTGGQSNPTVGDPCLLQLGHDGRGNVWNIGAYPPDPRCSVILWRAETEACEWVAGSVEELLHGVLGDDPGGPSLLQPEPRVLSADPPWFRWSHVDPPLERVDLALLDEPIELERRTIRGSETGAIEVVPLHLHLGWRIADTRFASMSAWVPLRERVAEARRGLRHAASCVGSAPARLTAWLDRVEQDVAYRRALLEAGLEIERELAWLVRDPCLRGVARRGGAYLAVYAWPPAGRTGVVRITLEAGARPTWLADDAEAFFDGLPGSLNAAPDPAPDCFACLYGDGDVPCPTDERARLKAFQDTNEDPKAIAAYYREIGWAEVADRAEEVDRFLTSLQTPPAEPG